MHVTGCRIMRHKKILLLLCVCRNKWNFFDALRLQLPLHALTPPAISPAVEVQRSSIWPVSVLIEFSLLKAQCDNFQRSNFHSVQNIVVLVPLVLRLTIPNYISVIFLHNICYRHYNLHCSIKCNTQCITCFKARTIQSPIDLVKYYKNILNSTLYSIWQ